MGTRTPQSYADALKPPAAAAHPTAPGVLPLGFSFHAATGFYLPVPNIPLANAMQLDLAAAAAAAAAAARAAEAAEAAEAARAAEAAEAAEAARAAEATEATEATEVTEVTEAVEAAEAVSAAEAAAAVTAATSPFNTDQGAAQEPRTSVTTPQVSPMRLVVNMPPQSNLDGLGKFKVVIPPGSSVVPWGDEVDASKWQNAKAIRNKRRIQTYDQHVANAFLISPPMPKRQATPQASTGSFANPPSPLSPQNAC